MQRLRSGPLVELAPPGADIWLDGGHNPAAGAAIATAFAEIEERDPRPLVLIAGMLTTKDPAGFFRPFAGLARHVMTVPVPDSQAGFDPANAGAASPWTSPRRAGARALRGPPAARRDPLRLAADAAEHGCNAGRLRSAHPDLRSTRSSMTPGHAMPDRRTAPASRRHPI